MALIWRSWQVVTVLVLTVVLVFCLLAILQFHRIESDLVRGRLEVLATSARTPFQSAARLGLPLDKVRNATAILERAQLTDPQIVAIHVFAPDGRILHSTDRDAPTSVRAEVLFAATGRPSAGWSTRAGDLLFTGEPIRDARGGAIGGIVVVYPTLDLRTSVEAMATKLLAHSLLVVIGMAPLTALLLGLGLRRPQRLFTAIMATLDGFERDSWRAGAGGTYAPPADAQTADFDTAELASLARTAETHYLAGGKALGEFEREGAR